MASAGNETREKQTEKKLTSSYHRKCKSSLKEKSLPSSCRRCADVGIIVGLHTLSPRNDERKNDAVPIYITTEETIQTEANVDLLTPLSSVSSILALVWRGRETPHDGEVLAGQGKRLG